MGAGSTPVDSRAFWEPLFRLAWLGVSVLMGGMSKPDQRVYWVHFSKRSYLVRLDSINHHNVIFFEPKHTPCDKLDCTIALAQETLWAACTQPGTQHKAEPSINSMPGSMFGFKPTTLPHPSVRYTSCYDRRRSNSRAVGSLCLYACTVTKAVQNGTRWCHYALTHVCVDRQ